MKSDVLNQIEDGEEQCQFINTQERMQWLNGMSGFMSQKSGLNIVETCQKLMNQIESAVTNY